jgi:hypothetical protein
MAYHFRQRAQALAGCLVAPAASLCLVRPVSPGGRLTQRIRAFPERASGDAILIPLLTPRKRLGRRSLLPVLLPEA